jgi:two-component system, sensor histidine kinase and response regulator
LSDLRSGVRSSFSSREEIERLCMFNLLANPEERVFFKDLQSRFLLVSAGYLAALAHGRSLDEVIGKTDFDIFSRPHAVAAFEDEQRVIETGEPMLAKVERETFHDRPDVWVSTIKAPLRDEQGNIIGTWGMSRDVTAQVDAELALRRSAERFQALTDQAFDLIVVTDADGVITYVNKAVERILGRRPEELVGTTVASWLHPADVAALETAIAAERETPGSVGEVDYRMRHDDGSWRWLETSGTNLVDEPAVGGFLVTLRDISERKAAEVERERAARLMRKQNAMLREADRLKSELLSIVSHDLRTPLTSVIGYLELLGDDEAGPLSAEQQSYLAAVRRGADRLLALVNDLLFIARADTGKLELDLADTDLAELARDAVHALLPKAADSSIRLGLLAEEPARARVDQARIAELLENLLSNALKFTPAGGSVDVRVAPQNGAVVLEVADTGVGISTHDQQHLFERFYRSKRTQAASGVGLGLSIVKAITQAHGGRITVESREQAGTTFRVSLPATAPKQSARRGAGTASAA